MAKTKIIATIGPSCETEEMIAQLVQAGVSIFRFNLKHNDPEWHSSRILRVNKVFKKLGKPPAILLDLQGPEIRIGGFEEGSITVETGETVTFAATRNKGEKVISVPKPDLLKTLTKGQVIFVDDGNLKFIVEKAHSEAVFARVLKGGEVRSRKGMNLPGFDVDLPVLIENDFRYLDMAARHEIDFVALSFARKKEDIQILRAEMKKRGVQADIIAKIENQQAINNFDEIISEADGVMVARGDLGVEIDYYEIPYWQKEMISKARMAGKPVITATQMLQSMIVSSVPTRAEVSDVANAVYDHTDAVMLSGETAIGKHPVEAVQVMEQTCRFSEEKRGGSIIGSDVCVTTAEAIVLSAYNLYRGLQKMNEKVRCFIVLTDSGKTARLLARYRPEIPIIAVTGSDRVRDKLVMSYGIEPHFVRSLTSTVASYRAVFDELKTERLVKSNDTVIIIQGKLWGEKGITNAISTERVS